ncbi:MAG: tandem-95 repeat protein, partial [Phycisphaeraceae bacterium]|nr:tandem-95 repeat protein [Phycisphaeraceae bacterium]
GAYVLVLDKTTQTSYVYQGRAGESAQFIVLSADAAGNVEAVPDGVYLPSYRPSINLGSLPSAPAAATRLPETEEVFAPTPISALFQWAILQVPGRQSITHPSSFIAIFEPFAAGAFVWNVPTSGADIGPLGIAFSPDGKSVYISGGAGRNSLYRFSTTGGAATTPLAVLDVPIYDMAFDSDGQLWATTGGGPLVQIDPATGQIVERYGEGINLGLVADPTAHKLYVSTRDGVEIFDTLTRQFTSFSNVRVDGLALAPDGTLWAATWPQDGLIVRFDQYGRAEVMLTLADEAEGLAFGPAGSLYAGLLFVSHDAGGVLTMVDLASMQTVEIATGGTRGDFLHFGPDGRLYLTQSNQVDVLQPVTPPHVLAMTPVPGSTLVPDVSTARVIFDVDMLAGSVSAAGSVINPNNFVLTDLLTGRAIPVGSLAYDPATRSVYLGFESLQPGEYELRVRSAVSSELGMTLESDYVGQFTVYAQPAVELFPTITNTRSDRAAGTISFDVSVTNTTAYTLGSMRLVFEGLVGLPVTLENVSGTTDTGAPYLDLPLGPAGLVAGGLLPGVTVTLSNPQWLTLDLRAKVVAQVPANERPVISSTPVGHATVGQTYAYDLLATDPDGFDLRYVLTEGPDGATLDIATGRLLWTPVKADAAQAILEVRVYDSAGAYTPQRWIVDVSGANDAPVLVPIADRTLAEGQLLEIPIGGFDLDGDSLIYGVEHLPAGATFDPGSGLLRWQTDGSSAGRYGNVTVWASDGLAKVIRTFEILVTNVNQAPVLAAIAPAIVQEGQTLRVLLSASDVDGDTLTYSSLNLPAGATLSQTTGVLTWTPRYDQHGTSHIDLTVSDGHLSSTKTLTVTILNVNGPVKFTDVGQWVVFEGQPVSIRIAADDPDHPTGASVLVPDGTVDSGGLEPALTWVHSTLPVGATFDAVTQTLAWTPGYKQAGTYAMTFTVTDDGDGTGAATSDTVTFTIVVRDANGAPVWSTIPNQTVAGGAAWSLIVAATDPDGGPLAIVGLNLPAFVQLVDRGNGTAVISASPTILQGGNYTLTLAATDNGNGDAQAVLSTPISFVLSVNVPNAPPRFAPVADQVALVGQELTLKLLVSDRNEDDLTFGGQNLPSGATFLGTSIYGEAIFRWTPTQAGTFEFTLTVHDSGNGDAAQTLADNLPVRVIVRAANAAPILVPIGDRQLSEGQTLHLSLSATDANGDAVSFLAANLPLGAVFDSLTGQFNWTPGYDQAGSYALHFAASDGQASTSEDLVVTVANVNLAPVMTLIPSVTGRENLRLQFTVAGGDLDGDAYSYFVDGPLPAGATFDPQTGAFAWTPGYDQAGVYTLRFGVIDPGGLTDVTEAKVEIVNVNRAPVIDRLSAHVALVGQPFTLDIPATDDDPGSTLTYSATGLPSGAAIDPATGVLSWLPSGVQVGEHDIRLQVSDGLTTSYATLHLVVSYQPVRPDVLIELTPSFAGPVGQAVLIHAAASGVADIATLEVFIDGTPVVLDQYGRARFTPTAAGHYQVTARATDVDRVIGLAAADLKVRDPSDAAAPVVELLAPPAGASLSAAAIVIARVLDDNLDSFTLEITPLGSNDWTTLASGTSPVDGQTLATIDPSLLADGAYLLRLSATDMAGRSTAVERVIAVNAANKPGNVVQFATDLSVTLGGFTLDFARVYQGYDHATAGLLGDGWQLSGFEPRFTTDLEPTGLEAIGLLPALRAGSRVYLNLPDGTRAGFTFTPTRLTLAGKDLFTPAWQADSSVTWQLRSADTLLEQVDGGFYEIGTGLAYNPAAGRFGGFDYTLVSAAGVTYDYRTDQGLRRITSSVGVHFLVDDGAVIGPDGARVEIRRDAQGRVTDLLGPAGQHVVYSYVDGQLTLAIELQSGRAYAYAYAGPDRRLSAVVTPIGSSSLVLHYDADGRLVGSDLIQQVLGSAGEFLGPLHAGHVAASQVERWAIRITPSELASSADGRVTLGVELRGLAGLGLAVPVIDGLAAGLTDADASHSLALFTFDQPGLYVLETRASNDQSAGDFTLDLYLAADANADGTVDGLDAAILDAALGTSSGQPGYQPTADADRNGLIDAADWLVLQANTGVEINTAPIVTPTSLNGREGQVLRIDLLPLVSDLQAGVLDLVLRNVRHGSAVLAGDGHTVLFAADLGYVGDAGFEFAAFDGSLASDWASVDVSLAAVAISSIQLLPKDPVLAPGSVLDLQVIATYADGATEQLPARLVVFNSSNPTAALVSSTGSVWAQSVGYSILTATVDNLVAATPILVGSAGSLPALPALEFFPTSYTLAPAGTRQLVVRELLADGTVVNRSNAADGTLYFVMDTSILSVTSDGLLRALAPGVSAVTIIHGGRSAIVPITVIPPHVGAGQVGADGAIVSNAQGYAAAVAAGALPVGTTVSLTTLSQAQLPMGLPGEFTFAGAFRLDMGGQVASTGLAISAPAPSGSQPGDVLIIFRPGKYLRDDGTLADGWEIIDRMVVGADGIARTTSPPNPSPTWEGILLLAEAPLGIVPFTMAAGVASTVQAAKATRTEIYVDPKNGQPYFSAPGLFFDFWIPLRPAVDVMKVARVAVDGTMTVRTLDLTHADPSVPVVVDIETPTAGDRTVKITRTEVVYTPDEPRLKIYGTGFEVGRLDLFEVVISDEQAPLIRPASLPVESEEPIRPADDDPAALIEGLGYRYYEGVWSSLPDFEHLTPVAIGVTENFDLSIAKRGDHFAIVFTGYYEASTEGTYTFHLRSDEGSRLYVGQRLVVDNDGLHDIKLASGSIALEAGRHRITVEYFDATGPQFLEVQVAGPGSTDQPIPDSKLNRLAEFAQLKGSQTVYRAEIVEVGVDYILIKPPASVPVGGGYVKVNKLVTEYVQEPGGGWQTRTVMSTGGTVQSLRPTKAPYYIYVVNQGNAYGDNGGETLTVIDPRYAGNAEYANGVVARIPVGKNPTDVAVSPDGLLAFVTNTGDGTISVIDTIGLRELDMNPNTPGLQRIAAGSTPGVPDEPVWGHPNYIALHPTLPFGVATDRTSGKIFIFSFTDSRASVFDVALDVPVTGLTGVDFSPNGQYIYIASPGLGSWSGADDHAPAGYVFIWDVAQGKTVGVLGGLQKPFGVTRSPIADKPFVAVAVRGSEVFGYTVIDTTRQTYQLRLATNLRGEEPTFPTSWQMGSAKLADIWKGLFDINNAEAITFDRQGDYAFVLFNNTYSQGNPARDPFNGMGGNIGIVVHPFDKTKAHFIAATSMAPFSWPDELTIDPYNRYLFATYKGLNAVVVYDLTKIRAALDLMNAYFPEGWQNYIDRSLEEYIALILGKTPAEFFASRDAIFQGYVNPHPLNLSAINASTLYEQFDRARKDLGDGNILVAKIGTGKLPSGIASGPEAPPDLIGVAVKLLDDSPATPDALEITYDINGREPDRPFLIAVFQSYIGTDPSNLLTPFFTATISGDDLTIRRHTLKVPLGRELLADEGLLYVVKIDYGDAIKDEADETNNLLTFEIPPLGVTAEFDGDPAKNVFGQYLVGVELLNTFRIRAADDLVNPDVAVKEVHVKIGDKDIALSDHGGGYWSFVYDVGKLEVDTPMLVDYVYRNDQTDHLEFTIDVLLPPDWVNPKKHTGANDPVRVAIQFNNAGAGFYQIVTQTLAPGIDLTVPQSVPLIGGRPIQAALGYFYSFNFDLAGVTTEQRIGPALVGNLLGKEFAIRLPMPKSGTLSTAQLTELISTNLTNAFRGVKNLYQTGSTGPSSPGYLENQFNSADKALQELTGGDESYSNLPPGTVYQRNRPGYERNNFGVTNREGLIPKDYDDVERAMSTSPALVTELSYEWSDLTIKKDLTIEDLSGGFTFAVTFKKTFPLISISTILAQIGPWVGVTVGAAIEVEPSLSFKLNVSPVGGLLTMTGGSVTGAFGLTGKGNISGKVLLGVAGVTGEIAISGAAQLDIKLTYDYGSGKFDIDPSSGWSFPFKIGGKIEGQVAFELVKADLWSFQLFSTDNLLGSPFTWSGWKSQVNITGSSSLDSLFPGDNLEPNNGYDSAADLGLVNGSAVVSAVTLHDADDADYYSFRLLTPAAADHNVAVTWTPGVAVGDNAFAVLLQDAQGGTLRTLTVTSDGSGTIDLTDLPAGLYYLIARGGPADGMGYSLTLTTPTTALPALAVDLDLANQIVEAGGTLTATVLIRNGGAAAPATQARLVLSRDAILDDNDASLLPVLNIPALAPGSAWQQTLTVTIPASVTGRVYVGIVADRRQEVAEDSKADNETLLPLVVALPADAYESNETGDFARDLGGMIATRVVEDLNIASYADSDWFKFDLLETGTADNYILVQRTDGAGHAWIILDDKLENRVLDNDAALSTTGNGADRLDLEGLAPGRYYLRVRTLDDTPFYYTLNLHSAERTGVNLTIQGVTVAPDFLPGSTMTARVLLSNNGSVDATGFDVAPSMSIGGVIHDLSAARRVGLLAAGQTQEITLTFTVPDMPLDQFVYFGVTVDSSADVSELNENDNLSFQTVLLAATPDAHEAVEAAQGQVDLGLVHGDLSIPGLTLHSFRDVDVTTLRLGAAGTSADFIELSMADPTVTARLSLYLPTFDLVAAADTDGSGVARLSLDGLPAGPYILVVENTGFLTHGDYALAIHAPEVVGVNLVAINLVTASSLLQGDTLDVTATLANLGDQAAGAFSFRYVLRPDELTDPDDGFFLTGPIAVSSLAAAASISDQRTLDLSAVAPGFYVLSVVVDADHAVPEAAESDNLATVGLIRLPGPDAFEPDDQFADAADVTLTDGQATTAAHTLDGPSDADWFRFDLPAAAGTADALRIARVGAEPSLTLGLYDDLGNLIQQITVGNALGALPLTGRAAGTYYIKVAPAGTTGYSSTYTLTIDAQQASAASQSASGSGQSLAVAPATQPITAAALWSDSLRGLWDHLFGPVANTAASLFSNDVGLFNVQSTDWTGDWTTRGDATVASNLLTLTESGDTMPSLRRSYTISSTGTKLRLTLNLSDLSANDDNAPDAFELALLDAGTGLPMLPGTGLGGSDALLSVQADGRVYFGPAVTVAGLARSGQTADLGQPLSIEIDLSALPDGAVFDLYLDLLTFAPHAGQATIADLTVGVPGSDHTPPTVVAAVVGDPALVQRSYVDTFSLRFSEAMNLASLIATGQITSAVTLVNRGLHADDDIDTPIALAPNQFHYDPVTFTLTWSLDAFAGGTSSLSNGYYELRLSPTLVTDLAGNGLSANDPVLTFHRLHGDVNGDARVDDADVEIVRSALGEVVDGATSAGNADTDRSGVITAVDLGAVLSALGRRVLPPSTPDTNDGVPPTVIAAIIQDGLVQRSYINRIVIRFSEATNIGDLVADGRILQVVSLVDLGRNVDADRDRIVQLKASEFNYNQQTFELTWHYIPSIPYAPTLGDGLYVLRISDDLLLDADGNRLDGDSDGTPAGDYTLTFHALRGDVNGDAIVDDADRELVRQSLGEATGAPQFNPNADLNRSGVVTAADLLIVQWAMGRRIVFPGGHDPAPTVLLSTLQDGLTQRSNVDTLTIRFSEPTNVPALIAGSQIAQAITLERLDLGSAVSVSLAVGQFQYAITTSTLRINFVIPPAGSLPDGHFRLRLDAGLIADLAGSALDGDHDGVPGGDWELDFHRLAGDVNGDGVVDITDMDLVRQSLGEAFGDSQFDRNTDLDADGVITGADLATVRQNLGHSV